MPGYRKITDNHEKLVRIAKLLKEKVEENHQKYETQTFQALEELNSYESMKQQCYDKYNACLLLQERFTKRQLLTVLENQISAMDVEQNPRKFEEK